MHERIDANKDTHIMDLSRKAHIKRYQTATKYTKPDDKILDIGCGTGYGSVMLAAKKNMVTAIDVDAGAIQYAQIHYNHPRVNYHHKSIEEVASAQKFDLITCFEVLEHTNNPDNTIKKCRELIKDSGTFFLSVPNGTNASHNNGHHKYRFYADDLHALCTNNGFTIQKTLEQYAPLGAIAEIVRLITGQSTTTNTEHSDFAKYINYVPGFADIFSGLYNRCYTLGTGRTLYVVAKPII